MAINLEKIINPLNEAVLAAYDDSIMHILEAYRALQQSNQQHELLNLIKLIEGGFMRTKEFEKKYLNEKYPNNTYTIKELTAVFEEYARQLRNVA